MQTSPLAGDLQHASLAPEHLEHLEQSPDAGEAPWSLGDMDADIREDLARAGIMLGDEATLDQSKRDALASTLLRLASEEQSEIERLDEAEEADQAILSAHYGRARDQAKRRLSGLLGHVEHLAEISAESGGFGKNKSAETPFGTFGVRNRAASVELIDPAALVADLAEHAPGLVKVTAKIPLSTAREYFTADELAAMKSEPMWSEVKKSIDPDGVMPPGVQKLPAARVPFATPVKPFGRASVAARLVAGAAGAAGGVR